MITTVFHAVAAWIIANPNLAATIATTFLVLALNGAMKHGASPGLVGLLTQLIDLLSPWTRKDAAGTWKMPVVTVRDGKLVLSFSQPTEPGSAPRSSAPPPSASSGVTSVAILILALSATGCGSSKTALVGTMSTADGMIRAFVDFDAGHELQIARDGIAACKGLPSVVDRNTCID